MPPDANALLQDICDAGEIIRLVTAQVSRDDYLKDVQAQSIVERQFITIGEALSRLRRKHPTVYGRIANGNAIIDFRNLLVHGYDVVDDRRVWRIVHEDLQPFLNDITQLLRLDP